MSHEFIKKLYDVIIIITSLSYFYSFRIVFQHSLNKHINK